MTAQKQQLDSLRSDMDTLDKEIKALLLKRFTVSDQVAKVKIQSNDRVYKPDREKEMVGRLSGEVAAPLREEYRQILTAVLNASRKYQYREIQKCTGRFEKLVPVKAAEEMKIDIQCLPVWPEGQLDTLVKGQFYQTPAVGLQQWGQIFNYLAYHQLYITLWEDKGRGVCTVDTCLYRKEGQGKTVLAVQCESLNELAGLMHCVGAYGVGMEKMTEHAGMYFIYLDKAVDNEAIKTLFLQLNEEFPLSRIVAVLP